MMKLSETLGRYEISDLRQRQIPKSYEGYRWHTERRVGAKQADELEHSVACVHEVLSRRLTGVRSSREEVCEFLMTEGWTLDEDPSAAAQFETCHQLACQYGEFHRAELSQFSGISFLDQLNERYFSQVGERTAVLMHPRVTGAKMALSDLGHTPNVGIAFGLKVLLPVAADSLLWWMLSQSLLARHFSVLTQRGTRSWAVTELQRQEFDGRYPALAIVGRCDFTLGSSRSEERFFFAPFAHQPDLSEEPLPEILEGTYIAYHSLA